MNKRKIMMMAMTLALCAILAVGGTLAYFTDNDQKTNTFTVGNVDIHIDEWMKDEEDNWVEYKDLQDLAPIAQSKAPFNKMVETVNDGKNDAYIRTFITCPANLWNQLGYGFQSGANAQDIVNEDGTTIHKLDKWSYVGPTTVAGKEVYIFVCEHYDAIPAGDSILSLTKVWVYENVDNSDIEGKLGENDEFEVLVYSEAIQADNLTYEEAMASLNAGKSDLEHATELLNSMVTANN